MSENNNGDICVSDANAGTIVVVDKKEKSGFDKTAHLLGEKKMWS